MTKSTFVRTIRHYYGKYGRDLPWRTEITPYKILVSEIMLQQTQVSRVLIKFPLFMQSFPNFESLASASFSEVLKVWLGMGYNRRVLYLHKIAKEIVTNHKGKLPLTIEELECLPGIGHATACSIYVFSANKPAIFIETNIRRVFIHFYFKDQLNVHDKQILPLVKQTLDTKNPREWYYALMDYGSFLARQVTNPNRRSKHYTKQSNFEGSDRQIRGQILKYLLQKQDLSTLAVDKNRLENILNILVRERLIRKTKNGYAIS